MWDHQCCSRYQHWSHCKCVLVLCAEVREISIRTARQGCQCLSMAASASAHTLVQHWGHSEWKQQLEMVAEEVGVEVHAFELCVADLIHCAY